MMCDPTSSIRTCLKPIRRTNWFACNVPSTKICDPGAPKPDRKRMSPGSTFPTKIFAPGKISKVVTNRQALPHSHTAKRFSAWRRVVGFSNDKHTPGRVGLPVSVAVPPQTRYTRVRRDTDTAAGAVKKPSSCQFQRAFLFAMDNFLLCRTQLNLRPWISLLFAVQR
jgi:hypothetical protein